MYSRRVDKTERRFGALDHRDRRGAVQRHDRRGLHALEEIVESEDLRPVRVFRARRLTVQRRDRGLQREGTGAAAQSLLDERQGFGDLRVIPPATVLLFEHGELTGVVESRISSRIVQQHQCEECRRLRGPLGRHQLSHESREPDRLGAEIGPHQLLAARRRVALVEDQVDHRQHRLEPARHVAGVRHGVRNARVADLRLRAYEPLRHRGRRHQERARDLVRLEPAERPERERDLRLDRQRRVAAGEDQPEPIVRDLVRIELRRWLHVGGPRGSRELIDLLAEPHPASDPIDRFVPGRLDDPCAWELGDARDTPLVDGRRKRLLCRFFGDVEVRDQADQRGDDASPVIAVHGLDREVGLYGLSHER